MKSGQLSVEMRTFERASVYHFCEYLMRSEQTKGALILRALWPLKRPWRVSLQDTLFFNLDSRCMKIGTRIREGNKLRTLSVRFTPVRLNVNNRHLTNSFFRKGYNHAPTIIRAGRSSISERPFFSLTSTEDSTNVDD